MIGEEKMYLNDRATNEFGDSGGGALERAPTNNPVVNDLLEAVKALAEFDPVMVQELFSEDANAYSRAMDLAELAYTEDPAADLRDWDDVETAPLKPLTQQMFEELMKR